MTAEMHLVQGSCLPDYKSILLDVPPSSTDKIFSLLLQPSPVFLPGNPETEEPCGLQLMGSQSIRPDLASKQ